MEIKDFFVFSTLIRLVFLEPLGVQRRYVPHFKGLISGNLELTAQRRDNTFTFSHSLLKKVILQRKRANRSNIFLPECKNTTVLTL